MAACREYFAKTQEPNTCSCPSRHRRFWHPCGLCRVDARCRARQL